jgi:pimeloyl-[acyl-carrier protein] methyl ester esterase
MNLRVFDALRTALAAHYTVTALDLPGHGRSAWISGQSRAEQLDQLAALLPPEATLVGWSLGGQLALQLAARSAVRVRQLVLLSSTPCFIRQPDWPHGLAPAVLQQFGVQLARDPQGTIADFLQLQVRGSTGAEAVRGTLQRALAEHGQASDAALAAGLQALQDTDLRALARALLVPTLVIGGQYDRVTPIAGAQALVQLMPHAQLLHLPRAGHAPFLSHAAEVLAALLALRHATQAVALS